MKPSAAATICFLVYAALPLPAQWVEGMTATDDRPPQAVADTTTERLDTADAVSAAVDCSVVAPVLERLRGQLQRSRIWQQLLRPQ